MRYASLPCLLLAAALYLSAAQEPSSPPAKSTAGRPATAAQDDDDKAMPAPSAKIQPTDAVITIKGLCSVPSQDGKQSCDTRISRADFENLVNALVPGKQEAKVHQLANSYPDLLILAQEAESRGLQNSERVQARLNFARLQILSQELLRNVDEQSAHIPQAEIEEYYRNHLDEFETASMERIFIPLRGLLANSSESNAAPRATDAARNSVDEMTKTAEALRAKAKTGETFFTLQKEAYAAAGMTDVPPNPSLGQLRRNALPPGQADAFDLKPGEVSKVFTDSTGHYIYKVVSREAQPLEKATDQIQRTLTRSRKEKAVQAIEQRITTVLNPEYFGASHSSGGTQGPRSK